MPQRAAATKDPDANLRLVARAMLGQAIGFRDCAAATLDELVAHGRVRHHSKGEFVGRKAEPFDAMGLVVKGSLEASVTRQDGHRHLLGLLQPGEIFGLASMIDGQGMLNDISARSASATLTIPGELVRRLGTPGSRLATGVDLHLAFRYRLLYERLISDTSVPLASRVAGMLQTLSQLYGLPRDGAIELNTKLSQADLADWIGVSRQRINFIVKQMQADGLIRLRYSAVTILDAERLAQRAKM